MGGGAHPLAWVVGLLLFKISAFNPHALISPARCGQEPSGFWGGGMVGGGVVGGFCSLSLGPLSGATVTTPGGGMLFSLTLHPTVGFSGTWASRCHMEPSAQSAEPAL